MNIKIVMMCKNEPDLLVPWILYHGNVFGFNNLFIFDNGTDDPVAQAQLDWATHLGVEINKTFTSTEDFRAKGEICAQKIKELDATDPADFYFPLDCDEFIGVETASGVLFDAGAVEKTLETHLGTHTALMIAAGYDNHPGMPGFFIRSGDQRKTFFAKNTCGFLDHGFHAGQSVYSDKRVKTEVIYVHYHYKPFAILIRHAKQKLIPFIDGYNKDDDQDFFSPEAIQRYRQAQTPGFHLLGHLETPDEETYLRKYFTGRYVELPLFKHALDLAGAQLPFAEQCLRPDDGRPHGPRLTHEREQLVPIAVNGTSGHEVEVGCHLQQADPTGDVKNSADGAGAHNALSIIGCLDEFTTAVFRGWIIDQVDPQAPVTVNIIVDGIFIMEIVCNELRPDLLAAGLGTETAGFSFSLPSEMFDGTPHELCFETASGHLIEVLSNGKGSRKITFDFAKQCDRSSILPFAPAVFGRLDDMHQNRFHGWAFREDHQSGIKKGGCIITVKLNTQTIAEIVADRPRPDVASEIGTELRCGFEFIPPLRYAKPYPQTFSFEIAPENVELVNSPMTTAFMDYKKLYDLSDTADRLFNDILSLRDALHDLLPASQFTVDNYDEWARRNQRALRRHVDLARQNRRYADNDTGTPLVSIIVPVYRPHIPHFEAAVESVIEQTYRHWELILVDDGSERDNLTNVIAGMALRDRRIRVVLDQPNGGISIATNRAIAEAVGEWIVFFDHDDLLVDVAIEVMVVAAQRSAASILFSDEDKIDEAGHYSEPAFKPDWNLRLLMANNYVCHLLMVRAEIISQVGGLRTEYDGAQDHDLILRLSQVVSRDAILHVPEVLYHWRKTANSTASVVSNKSYAIAAGAACVRSFVESLGHDAAVDSVLSSTTYRIKWRFTQEPKVTVIIPFRDGIDMTSRCLSKLLEVTNYKNYDVILVDNGSVTAEAASFCTQATDDHRVRVLPVPEEFNYSRLNNLAARITDAEHLLFMNNDVFVSDPDWMRILVNEALVAPDVGIVGCKLFYESGLIQHAGVILGIHGVAGHAFSGMPHDCVGYAGRAALAQELSAVTAACMLMRAEVFHNVGGFDEDLLKVAFNDIDICMKTRRAGYRIVWTADCQAEHHESVSRGNDEDPIRHARFTREVSTMIERWGSLLSRDPNYSKHFALNREPYFDLVLPENNLIDLL